MTLLHQTFLPALDPCSNVTCRYYATCRAYGPRDARCVCADDCPSYEEPVCSSNGTTYDNECLYKLDMCQTQGDFTISHPGSCRGQHVGLVLLVLMLHILNFCESSQVISPGRVRNTYCNGWSSEWMSDCVCQRLGEWVGELVSECIWVSL